jgi:hypothetical protein
VYEGFKPFKYRWRFHSHRDRADERNAHNRLVSGKVRSTEACHAAHANDAASATNAFAAASFADAANSTGTADTIPAPNTAKSRYSFTSADRDPADIVATALSAAGFSSTVSTAAGLAAASVTSAISATTDISKSKSAGLIPTADRPSSGPCASHQANTQAIESRWY